MNKESNIPERTSDPLFETSKHKGNKNYSEMTDFYGVIAIAVIIDLIILAIWKGILS